MAKTEPSWGFQSDFDLEPIDSDRIQAIVAEIVERINFDIPENKRNDLGRAVSRYRALAERNKRGETDPAFKRPTDMGVRATLGAVAAKADELSDMLNRLDDVSRRVLSEGFSLEKLESVEDELDALAAFARHQADQHAQKKRGGDIDPLDGLIYDLIRLDVGVEKNRAGGMRQLDLLTLTYICLELLEPEIYNPKKPANWRGVEERVRAIRKHHEENPTP